MSPAFARVQASLMACCLLLVRTETGAAQSRILRLQSKILGEERIVHVALPPNYAQARQRYQVTYLLDGHVRAFFDLTVAAAGYDLAGDVRDYAIPPQIVVGVEQKDRSADLGRNQELFSRFLREELIPRIDRDYRTHPYRTLIGHSLGGRFALNELCRAHGMFRAIVAMSPGGGDSTNMASLTACLQRSIDESGEVAQQVVLIAGAREPQALVKTRRIHEFLTGAAPGWRVSLLDGADVGHAETPFVGIPLGLRQVHHAIVWEMPPAMVDSLLNGRADPGAVIASWYARLSAHVGYAVPPAAKWLRAATAKYLSRHQLDSAEGSARRTVEAFPEDLAGYALLADVHLAGDNSDAARRVLEEALRVIDRLEFFDESERILKRASLRTSLEKLQRS